MEAVKPAQLAFLTLYNPSLGQTDENIDDQVVYHYNTKYRELKKTNGSLSPEQEREEKNEKLRQIGLAQGMIEFAKAFSDGATVDAVDSEKSRILTHQLEPGWWMLASVDLTQIRTVGKSTGSKSQPATAEAKVEYSAREVSPQGLLLRHLLHAHSIFLLHHASSLADLFVRLPKPKFCAALERFWNKFIKDWDVLLHGTPAIDIFPGLRLAAGGELGIGVGEEEWGSGEREVLEDFVHRTEGLIDVVVSRFGDFDDLAPKGESPWLNSGKLPNSSDGVIFSGTGGVTRSSIASISLWMEWMFQYGPSAYGVQDNPHGARRRKRRKGDQAKKTDKADTSLDAWPLGIPPPIVNAANHSLDAAVSKVAKQKSQPESSTTTATSNLGTEALMKYMTFGLYGSGWGLPSNNSMDSSGLNSIKQDELDSKQPNSVKNLPTNDAKVENQSSSDPAPVMYDALKGCFLIGLKGDLDDDGGTDEEDRTDSAEDQQGSTGPKAWNSRILLRTLHIERKRRLTKAEELELNEDTKTAAQEYFDRVQVIVYVHRPFIFTFIFELQTPTLGYPSFYRSIHHQLGPLQRPLLHSTSPKNVYSRLYEAVSPRTVTPVDNKQPIYDLVYDPNNHTIHTTIPPIPELSDVAEAHGDSGTWSRLDALNVHSQIVSTFFSTRKQISELERTAKTNRGWWVVWMRLPSGDGHSYREAFLVRKSTDYIEDRGRKISLGFGKDTTTWGTTAGKVAEGIGIDARRYVEGLLSLSR